MLTFVGLTCHGFTFGMGASTNFFGWASDDCCCSADCAGASGCCEGVLCGLEGPPRRSRSRLPFPLLRPCAITGTKPSSSSSSCCCLGGGSTTSPAAGASMFSLLHSTPLKLSTDAYEGPAASADTRAAMPPPPSSLCKPGRALRADRRSRARLHAP